MARNPQQQRSGDSGIDPWLTIQWGYVPPEVRKAVRPLLLQYLWLVPPWCRLLVVDYQRVHEKGETVPGSMSGMEHYRFAEITLCARWLDNSPESRRLDIIHEMLHIPTYPMAENHRKTLERFFGDGDAKLHETLQEAASEKYEGCVQDLSLSLSLIPESALPRTPFREVEDEHPIPEPDDELRSGRVLRTVKKSAEEGRFSREEARAAVLAAKEQKAKKGA